MRNCVDCKKEVSKKALRCRPCSKKGRIFTAEHKAKLSVAKKGKPSPRRGIPMSEEQKKKLSDGHKLLGIRPIQRASFPFGELHPLWKGGKTPLMAQIRHSFEYRQWKSDIFTRDDFTCQLCGKRGGDLNADHFPKMFCEIIEVNKILTFEAAVKCSELWDLNNGRTLCVPCHKQFGRRKQHG